MTILLSDLGKRYNYDWIFRHLHYQFKSGTCYALTGPNGSGKSTLLQLIGGALFYNEGSITYQEDTATTIAPEEIYKKISLCAPYLELIEEMTGIEFLQFHQRFKPFIPTITPAQILEEIGLTPAAHKQIRYYSSGMKQRLKLGQCFFGDAPIILLDEPCTNLDAAGITIYQQLLERHKKNKVVLIASNDPVEYQQCTEQLRLNYYLSSTNLDPYTSAETAD
jgi:ABC-type multidrug transport system ATPase subunit